MEQYSRPYYTIHDNHRLRPAIGQGVVRDGGGGGRGGDGECVKGVLRQEGTEGGHLNGAWAP